MSTSLATSRAGGRSLRFGAITGGAMFVVFTALFTLAAPMMVVLMDIGAARHAAPPDCSSECSDVHPVALDAYQVQAEETCEGLDWTVLAGIGQVESRHGTLYGGSFNERGILEPPIFGPPLDGRGSCSA